MKTLKQMLSGKDRQLAVVAPCDTVFHALSVMAANDVGALLVLRGMTAMKGSSSRLAK